METPNQTNATPSEAAAEALLDKLYPTMKPEAETQPAAKPQESQAPGEAGPGEKPPDQNEKKPEAKPAEQTERKPEVMSTKEYGDIRIPELPAGAQLDEGTLNEFAALVREAGLPKEQAQKLLDFGGAKVKAMVEAPYKQWNQQQQDWQAEVKADPEIGGTKFEQSVKDVALIFKPSESNPFCKTAAEADALKKGLMWTGAGNHPAVVKFFVRAARLMANRGGLSKLYDKM